MPTLKHLTCHVEWTSSQVPLGEFQTSYADGYVETYIAVPSFPTPFEVHLTSNGYIAPGLAMFVFMDGVYQCNRNRQNLQIPTEGVPKNLTEVDFQVNQKERQVEDGSFHGKDWRFEKVNIVESSDIDTEQRAPYDGEYIGIIEVVVLRCFPDENATPPGTPRSSIDAKSVKNSDEESEIEGSFPEKLFEGVADTADTTPATDPVPSPPPPPTPTPKCVHKTKPKADDLKTRGLVRIRGGKGSGGCETKLLPRGLYRIRHRDSQPSKAKPKRPMFGLDGALDRDEDAKTTSVITQAPEKSTALKTSKKNHASDTRGYPALTAWDKSISRNAEPISNRAGESSENTTTSSGEPKKGRTEMVRATTSHPVRVPANSSKPVVKRKSQKDRSDPRATFSKDWGTSPRLASPGRGRSRKPRSLVGHREESPLLNLRGGGPGSYSMSSVNGAATPSVVININNNGGPPPPRNWQAEAEEARKIAKANRKQTSSANDTGTTVPPACDPKPDRDVKQKTKKELKKEKKQKKKQMPGAWGDSNEQNEDGGWGDNDNNNWGNAVNDDNQNDGEDNWGNTTWNTGNDDNKNGDDSNWGNDNWNTTGNDDNQDNNNDCNNTGADTSWDTSKDDAHDNDDGWGNNDNNDEQQGNGWGNNNSNDSGSDNEEETSGWGNTNNEDNNKWNANKKDKSKVTVGAKDPATLKPGKNNPKSNGPIPGSAKTKASKKGKQKAFDVGDWGKGKPEKASSARAESKRTPSPKAATPKSILKSSPKLPSIPGAWSPPLPPTRSNSKSPKANASSSTKPRTPKYLRPRPILSISTSPPQPQPYWATWADLSPTEEKVQSVTTAANEIIDSILSEPLYSIPASVARRSSMSHQVRPGRSTTYRHRRGVPKYMDDFSKPYAVFRFHYRDREIVECMTGTTIVEPEIDEKQRMASLTKEEIIEEFMKVKKMLGSEGSGNGSKEGGGESESGSGRRTWKSNPGGEVVGPDLQKLDERLRRLETSAEDDDEVVVGWLEGTGGDEEWAEKDDDGGGTEGNASDKGDKDSKRKGKGKGKEKEAENSNAGDTGGNENDNSGWNTQGKGKKNKKGKGNTNPTTNTNANANTNTNRGSKGGTKGNDIATASKGTKGNNTTTNHNTGNKKKRENDWNANDNDNDGGGRAGGW